MSATRNIKVIRAFYWQGQALPVGTIKELPTAFALEMHACGKVEIIQLEKAASQEVPPTRTRGGKDAS